MIVHRTDADEVQSILCRNLSCLNIEIIQHFDVIADETKRHHYHFTCALSRKLR